MLLVQRNFSANAQNSTCDNNKTTVREHISVTGTYKIWVLLKKETPNATAHMNVDGGGCKTLSLPESPEWKWVEANTGSDSTVLDAGEHSFDLAVTEGSVLFDKILATNITNCIPKGTGENCFVELLDFYVDGITENDVVNAEKTIKTVITSQPADSANVTYLINDKIVQSTSSTGYCLVETGGSCEAYNFSTLEVGNHALEVSVTSGDQTVSKTIPFSVVNSATPIPEVPALSPSGSPTQNLPELPFSIEGITEGQKVEGPATIRANVPDLGTATSLRFTLNTTVLSNDYQSPYCAVGSTACEVWDSSTVVNGNYTLIVTAAAEGYKTTSKTVKFTVENKPPSVTSTTPSTRVAETVVGVPNQQATGIVKLSVPKKQVTPGSKITYKIDNKVVATTDSKNPTATVDTGQFANGTKPISAIVQKPTGEKKVLSGDVTIRNDSITTSTNWFSKNRLLLAFFIVVSTLLITFIIRFIIRKINERQLISNHNVDDTYSYIQPEATYTQQASQGFAALAIVFVGVFAVGKLGTIQAATGLGFIAEIEDGIGQFTVGTDGSGARYAQISYTAPATTPSPSPETPAPSNPPPSPPANTGAAWADEFNGPLDMSRPGYVGKWSPNEFGGDGVGYEDFAGQSWNINPFQSPQDNPFSITDSILRITMKRTTPSLNTVTSEQWAGAYIITNPAVESFTYGYFESRIRWPNPGVGMFPAFWLYETNGGQREIDIMEIFGSPTGRPWTATIHHSNSQTNNSFDVDKDTTGWHTYGLDWQPNYLRWYYDGEFVGEMTGTDASYFNKPMSIRLNFSMDAPWFWQKSDGTTPNPMFMDVDYVRYWPTKPN